MMNKYGHWEKVGLLDSCIKRFHVQQLPQIILRLQYNNNKLKGENIM